MNTFSISQLQEFSGIKAHTIRMWEQRYNALNPTRSEGNTRYYDNSQLRRLLNIVSLLNSEYKVSELCSMPDEMLFKAIDSELKNSPGTDAATEYFISQLIAAGMCYDEPYFDKIFSNCLLRFGLKETYVKVIYPVLVRIGLMWSIDKMPPAQEHFISNILRQKFFSAIDILPLPTSTKNSWILFLPENEFHEIGLLFSHYLLRLAGIKVFYLGSNVPFETLINSVKEINPGHLFFFLVHHNVAENIQKYLNTLTKSFDKIKIHLSGNEKLIKQLKLAKEIQWIKSIDDLLFLAL